MSNCAILFVIIKGKKKRKYPHGHFVHFCFQWQRYPWYRELNGKREHWTRSPGTCVWPAQTTKPLPQRFCLSGSGRSTLSFLGLDLTVQHLAEVKLKYGSTLKGPAEPRREKARCWKPWKRRRHIQKGSREHHWAHVTEYAGVYIVHFWKWATPGLEGFWWGSGAPTVWFRLPFATRASLFNVKCHKSLGKSLVKNILMTYLTLCIRSWWLCICSLYLYPFMPLPSPCHPVSKAHVQSWPRLSIPLHVTS